jgi:parallel beta-helix repeat protein
VRQARPSIGALSVLGFALGCIPATAPAAVSRVAPGQSIQEAVDAASPGDTIIVMPGDYTETHAGTAAVRITKPLRLLAKSSLPKTKVRILPGSGQKHGIIVEPANQGDPDVVGVTIKGFTIEGFPNNGIWLRHVDNFKIERNESISNLENGIWPTLSANGLVKKNVAYGSEDSALWIEASENVRVLDNEFHDSPTGLEITVSKNIVAKNNNIHHNTTGIGLYHPSAASLPPLGGDGNWDIVGNYVHDNNEPNDAPPGSMSASLPAGGGILVLGVDNVKIQRNRIEGNNFYGITVVDYCVAVAGSKFDCSSNPPQVESAPDDNTYVSNVLKNNGTAPTPFGGLENFAGDVTYLMLDTGHANCFAKNKYATFEDPFLPPIMAQSCKPLP